MFWGRISKAYDRKINWRGLCRLRELYPSNTSAKVLMKIVARCNGGKAMTLANVINNTLPISSDEAWNLSHKVGFGCANCLFVFAESEVIGMNDDLMSNWIGQIDFALYS